MECLGLGLSVPQLYDDLYAFLAWTRDGTDIDPTRVLASTSGSWFGRIPELSKPNDLVCLIEGQPFPFIVRERDDEYYTLIGDAYVDGIMLGEAWPESEDAVQWITLVWAYVAQWTKRPLRRIIETQSITSIITAMAPHSALLSVTFP